MIDARRLAYLDALGVDVYVRRGLEAVPVAAEATAAQAVSVPIPPEAGSRASATVAATARVAEATLDWEPLRAAVAACTRCPLHETRTQTVFGVGNRRAKWMFVGEAPGADEDRQGEPFVGRAGQLLTSMLKALGFAREDVYIANVLKCRPPGNRDPKPEEALQCRGYLDRQIELVSPALIVAVGRIAAQNLLATETALARLRGKVHALGPRGWPLVVTYHPAYLLRSPAEKRKAWQDLLFARQVFASLEAGERVTP
jgi:DNA polymerase